jgi:hypothetical protein
MTVCDDAKAMHDDLIRLRHDLHREPDGSVSAQP